ncbi:hypothetical protein P7K49_014867 [Saguinus oedipus]|uniref:Uncharacterized protein n=1 Tax=Saguinus oedipus TaxID=9490 RepID=A0ABQ9V9J3_SAGOE|nr:hypothetical protein P7K49_014867 [Saguinus oedipus]
METLSHDLAAKAIITQQCLKWWERGILLAPWKLPEKSSAAGECQRYPSTWVALEGCSPEPLVGSLSKFEQAALQSPSPLVVTDFAWTLCLVLQESTGTPPSVGLTDTDQCLRM